MQITLFATNQYFSTKQQMLFKDYRHNTVLYGYRELRHKQDISIFPFHFLEMQPYHEF